MKITFSEIDVTYNNKKKTFHTNANDETEISFYDVMRYLKGIYGNQNRFLSRFIKKNMLPYINGNPLTDETGLPLKGPDGKYINEAEAKARRGMLDENGLDTSGILYKMYMKFDNVEPYSFREAFQIEYLPFKALVFRSIDVGDMIANLGHKRIKTSGKEVTRKMYDELTGEYSHDEKMNVVYELHKVDMTQLLTQEQINNIAPWRQPKTVAYAIKCWCTTVGSEHWIFIDEKYAENENPFEAIASTFMVHENIIPFITQLKRQGDILVAELAEDCEVEPSGKMVPLTEEQYFSLLTAEA